MMTWAEIKELSCGTNNRAVYEREYMLRKTYDKLLPMVDQLYDAYLLCAVANGYNDLAKSGASASWAVFVEDFKGTVVEEWINKMNGACCADELREYFRNKIRKQEEIVYANER